jgi:uncharacterized protein YaeQ
MKDINMVYGTGNDAKRIAELEAQLELCKPLLKSYQTTIAGSRGMCDEDERDLWDRIDAALIQESE